MNDKLANAQASFLSQNTEFKKMDDDNDGWMTKQTGREK